MRQACAVNKDSAGIPPRSTSTAARSRSVTLGASGARVLVTLLHETGRRRRLRRASPRCIGGGMGIAAHCT
jgi:acetyl-CoA C-acetyltransferase